MGGDHDSAFVQEHGAAPGNLQFRLLAMLLAKKEPRERTCKALWASLRDRGDKWTYQQSVHHALDRFQKKFGWARATPLDDSGQLCFTVTPTGEQYFREWCDRMLVEAQILDGAIREVKWKG